LPDTFLLDASQHGRKLRWHSNAASFIRGNPRRRTSSGSARAGEQGRHSASLHESRGQARAERSQNRCHAASAVLLSTFSNLLSGVPATPPGCQILEGFGRLCRPALRPYGAKACKLTSGRTSPLRACVPALSERSESNVRLRLLSLFPIRWSLPVSRLAR
jgi:hypothetical protein